MNAREREVMDALATELRGWHEAVGGNGVDRAALAAYDALVAQDSSEGSGEADQAPRDAGAEARDAARYRWLRQGSVPMLCIRADRWNGLHNVRMMGIEADAAIDAAIAAQQRQGERT